MSFGKFSHDAFFGLKPEDLNARKIPSKLGSPLAKSFFDILRLDGYKKSEEILLLSHRKVVTLHRET